MNAPNQAATRSMSSVVAARSAPGTGAGGVRWSSRCSRVCWATATRPPSRRATSSAHARAAGSAPFTARTRSPRRCHASASATAALRGMGSRNGGRGGNGAVRIATPTTAPEASRTTSHQTSSAARRPRARRAAIRRVTLATTVPTTGSAAR
ncbi:hypothetical protein V2I01_36220 [Micromonospora sp. BRA006-A]|nr:hypothetical protein [Micromonospora sp. BRA006-A]